MSRKMRSLQTFKVHRARATVRRWLQQIELSGLAIALWTGDRTFIFPPTLTNLC
ncbi:hypothetical protein K4039_25050 [Lyngbya sp. CCAP 1446/10]|uniref:hypothetical protein n=1 Tax=Lyngbya sp. CCAP 1446/10 TaxID=439293 RepID=UPI0022386171|nr:hypothetical protein [Lyngbya sp. CCAP 1446/10]MCW6053247.1 hypothetical protein [Lyngbya sp. CCAP 1446/10]